MGVLLVLWAPSSSDWLALDTLPRSLELAECATLVLVVERTECVAIPAQNTQSGTTFQSQVK